MISLRQRIRKTKINCVPWKRYRYEVERLPISAQCLFSKTGLSYDTFETELKEEGWLFEDENLLEVLENPENLKRKHLSKIEFNHNEPFDETWTEEDFINYYERN